jgi:DNA-binding SARP family transcriptional activator
MGGVDYRILGSLEAVRDGQRLPLGGSKQRAVLAILLLGANRVVTTDELIEALWGESPPGKPQTAIQGYVSQLRKTLDPDRAFEVIVTEPAGYRLSAGPDELDLYRLESLLRDGRDALQAGRADAAASSLREALALFRGPPLAEFTYESWAQVEIGRLLELKLICLEERVEADLRLGRHGELVGEIEALVREYPLRERLRGHLMLALYRSGRQSEALAAYQDARRVLVDEFGIDPTRALQELERRMLQQDPALELEPATGVAERAEPLVASRSILLVPRAGDAALPLVEIGTPLASSLVPHELIVARLVDTTVGSAQERDESLARATAELRDVQAGLVERGIGVRVAAFTSAAIGDDVVRLASEQDVDLVLLERSSDDLEGGALDVELQVVFANAPCDAAVCLLRNRGVESDVVIVPFGGGVHDWAALELGAWLASAKDGRLRLLGVTGDPTSGKRDASRLLAAASLAVQRLVGVPTEPALTPAGAEGLLQASKAAGLLVAGVPEDWRERGLGEVRFEIAASAQLTTLFVRRGIRPGGLAPSESQTRFTWSLSDTGSVT